MRGTLTGSKALSVTILAAALTAAVFVYTGSGDATDPSLPATVSGFSTVIESKTYPSTTGNVNWRVARNTGNCCENYIAATPTGRLYDFGGSLLRYTDDNGQSWSQVRPVLGALSAEGAVVYAANGDVLAMTWDPYSGDRVMTYRQSAATGTWEYQEQALKTPFFDRPWLGVFKGPFTINGVTGPYLAVLKGGWPSQEVVYYSLDGLNYLLLDSPSAESWPFGSTATALSPGVDAGRDWTQPLASSGLTPVSAGLGLSVKNAYPTASFGFCNWRSIDSLGAWRCRDTPGGLGANTGRLLIDGAGRLHQVVLCGGSCFQYRWSSNGGASWGSTAITLPGEVIESMDFKAVSGVGAGITAIALHTHRTAAGVDRDLIYKFTGFPPVLSQILEVGLGDVDIGVGAAETGPRFDFTSVAILPSGKLAVSFADSQHLQPAVAIQT